MNTVMKDKLDDLKYLYFIEDQVQLDTLYLQDQMLNYDQVYQATNSLKEHLFMFSHLQTTLKTHQQPSSTNHQKHIHLEKNHINYQYICGVVELKNKNRLERMIFRAGKGNVC